MSPGQRVTYILSGGQQFAFPVILKDNRRPSRNPAYEDALGFAEKRREGRRKNLKRAGRAVTALFMHLNQTCGHAVQECSPRKYIWRLWWTVWSDSRNRHDGGKIFWRMVGNILDGADRMRSISERDDFIFDRLAPLDEEWGKPWMWNLMGRITRVLIPSAVSDFPSWTAFPRKGSLRWNIKYLFKVLSVENKMIRTVTAVPVLEKKMEAGEKLRVYERLKALAGRSFDVPAVKNICAFVAARAD